MVYTKAVYDQAPSPKFTIVHLISVKTASSSAGRGRPVDAAVVLVRDCGQLADAVACHSCT